ncbi:MAG: tRNA pseudouridine(38-40) synthase TruA [Paludibacteraceae bacterium]|nr:tRNA pseudouridine(38-40) synthase TruA [Paludibacteraceae bacterium]MBR6105499.1 tRNA pseudouridine(38-40) synthase TruA [Paludibacteraceae bacterium]
MQRYFVQLSYNGGAYHGWQIQPSGITVQEELNKAFATILRNPDISLTGAGRTDAGVHAKMMVAHFDLEAPLTTDLDKLVANLNSLLPFDIAIQKIWAVEPDMHARFSAKMRTYKYYLTLKKNPFTPALVTRIIGDLDFEEMNKAAKCLLNYSDFTSFSKLHTDTKTNNCFITEAYWQEEEDMWVFTISADRFLRNMVRAIVGTLLEVGRGKMSVQHFCEIIEKKDRCSAGTSAPPQGLYLYKIEY